MTKKKTSNRRSGRGSVLLIVFLFLGSAGLRLGLGAETALAETGTKEPISSASTETSQEQHMDKTDSDVSDLLTALLKREKEVEKRELQLELNAKSLEIAKTEIERRIVALEAMEIKLKSTLAQADSAAEKDIARLTSVYENMKPPEAAALFEAMEPAFAAGFLGRMRPDAAAAILAGLDPKTAYTISILLAGRNAKVPKS